MAQLMPLPLSLCFSKIQIGFTFLVPAHPGSPGQSIIKRVCVCVLRSQKPQKGLGWLGSRVVSVLDSGAEGTRVQIAVATLSGNSHRKTVHTHCASVHQAAELVAALSRIAGLAESNGSLLPGL